MQIVTRQFLDAGTRSEVASRGRVHSFTADRIERARVASIDRYLISTARAGHRREGGTSTPGEARGKTRQHVARRVRRGRKKRRERRRATAAPLGIFGRGPGLRVGPVSANNVDGFVLRLARELASGPPGPGLPSSICGPRNPGESPISSSRFKKQRFE